MKKTFIRILALLLVAVMMMTVFVSCKKEDKGDGDESDKTTESSGGAGYGATTELTPAEILGFDEQNYEGRKFKMFVNNGYPLTERDFYIEDTKVGDSTLTKAIYERNIACQEYLGIELELVREDGRLTAKYADSLRESIQAETCDLDMVAMGLNTGIVGGYIDIYNNVMTMDYINLEHEWWVQDMIEQTSINNQLYFLTGDICLSTYSYIGCILANLQVADDWDVNEDLFEIVRSGGWTLDKMFELYKKVGLDENGNDKMDPGSETYGWCIHNALVRLMWSSCGMEVIVRQADGTFALRDSLDDRMLNMANKLITEYKDIHSNHVAEDKDMIDDFINNRTFLVSTYLGRVEDMKKNDIASPFAILPMPKYDTNQENYISANFAAYNAIFFPITVEDADLSAQVAEYMGWQGKKSLVPEYYDVAMKYKSSDVTENIEMFDLIRDSLRVTPNESYGVIEGESGGSAMSWLQLTDWNAKGGRFYDTPTSHWTTNVPAVKKAVQNYVLKYFD